MPTTYTESPRTRDLPPRYRVFLWQIVRYNGTRGHTLRTTMGRKPSTGAEFKNSSENAPAEGIFPTTV